MRVDLWRCDLLLYFVNQKEKTMTIDWEDVANENVIDFANYKDFEHCKYIECNSIGLGFKNPEIDIDITHDGDGSGVFELRLGENTCFLKRHELAEFAHVLSVLIDSGGKYKPTGPLVGMD